MIDKELYKKLDSLSRVECLLCENRDPDELIKLEKTRDKHKIIFNLKSEDNLNQFNSELFNSIKKNDFDLFNEIEIRTIIFGNRFELEITVKNEK